MVRAIFLLKYLYLYLKHQDEVFCVVDEQGAEHIMRFATFEINLGRPGVEILLQIFEALAVVLANVDNAIQVHLL